MDTFEHRRYTDKQIEELANHLEDLRDKFPTRQQRRAEERKRRKSETKKEINKSQKITF